MYKWEIDKIQFTLDATFQALMEAYEGKKIEGPDLETLERVVGLKMRLQSHHPPFPIHEVEAGLIGCGIFDVNFYLSGHRDIREEFGTNYILATEHWLNTGITEGRQGCAAFHSKWYLLHHPDVREKVGEGNYLGAIRHWLDSGIKDGRQGCGIFNPRFYLENYSDLKLTFGEQGFERAVNHWVISGTREGRQGANLNPSRAL